MEKKLEMEIFYKLELKDAIEFLKGFSDESVDLLITDPAYESMEKHRKIGTTTRLKCSNGSSNKWFKIFPNDRFEDLFKEVYRVLKPNTHFYLFCNSDTMFDVKHIGEEVGFKFWKPIIWDKMAIGMGYHYRSRYEIILFFEKGKRKLNNLGIPDVLTFKRVYNSYPTEKPVGLLEVLVHQSSKTGEIIVDPFMGSGSTGVASIINGRVFKGCDINEESLEMTALRLHGIK